MKRNIRLNIQSKTKKPKAGFCHEGKRPLHPFHLLLAVLLILSLLPGMPSYADPITHNINTDGSITISSPGEYHIIGTGTATTNTIQVTTDATVTLDNVHIDVSSAGGAFDIGSRVTVTLLLKGKNILKSGMFDAGLHLPPSSFLTIRQQDSTAASLTATSNGIGFGAGIGGNYKESCGHLTIDSGEITAGSIYGAGIGAGIRYDPDANLDGGKITIRGGRVTAGSQFGAGIGGGTAADYARPFKGGDGSDLTITGGSLTASSADGYAIGGGRGGKNISGPDYGPAGGPGKFASTGNAIVVASCKNPVAIQDQTKKPDWSGLIYENTKGQVYGQPALSPDTAGQSEIILPKDKQLIVPGGSSLTIQQGTNLTLPAGASLLIDAAGSLINQGSLINSGDILNKGSLHNTGTIDNSGKLDNNGNIKNHGSIAGSGTFNGAALEQLTQAVLPALSLSYPDEQITGFQSDTQYLIHKGSAVIPSPSSGQPLPITADMLGQDLTVMALGDYITTRNSEIQALSIPQRPAAPTGLTVHPQVTTAGGIELGWIGGVSPAMEFQAVGSSSWAIAPQDKLTGLTLGSRYLLRYRATDHSFASLATTLSLDQQVYGIDISGGTAYLGSNPVQNSTSGAAITIRAGIPEGQLFDHWTVKPEGLLTDISKAETGFTMPAAAVTLKAVFKEMPKPPTPPTPPPTPPTPPTPTPGPSDPSSGSGGERERPNRQIPTVLQPIVSPAPQPPAPPSITFGNVTTNDWYAPAVDFVTKYQLMTGTGNGKFSPTLPGRRSTLIAILYNLEFRDKPAPPVMNSSFTDVQPSDWFAPAVGWAQQQGLIAGIDGQFHANEELTREQIAMMIYQYAQHKQLFLPSGSTRLQDFRDQGSISPWAKKAMQWAVETGILSGKGKGILDPKAPATRAELAAMLMQFVQQAGIR